MSIVMEKEVEHWTAHRKSVLVLEAVQGRTSASEAIR